MLFFLIKSMITIS